ncbi:fungal-specific transcription factor domain-containing protein [Phyllosticta citriasiana]|uniref:Fungal-specific transcription factor domain-containing protein n=1 Tax=Phyllosticta citriasiana TaxID=595635 RepID=A0ABR1K7L6_9PEZI
MASPDSSNPPPPRHESPSRPPTASPAVKPHAAPSKIRRRNRLITSCLECRRRKLKCDKLHPCSNCTRFSRDCVFLAPALDAASQLKLAEIKEKMGSLERTLEEDVARKSLRRSRSESRPGSSLPGLEGASSEEEFSEAEDERGLEPTPLALEAAPYDDDGNDDNILDLGVQFGRLRITERIGGFVRPKLAQELTEALKEVPELFPDPLEPHPFTKKIHPSAYLVPGPDYLAPSASFFFAPTVRKNSLINSLPAKSMADTLLKQYWRAVHPVAPAVHRPSFERQYTAFWKDISVGVEPRSSLQALILAAMLSAAVSLSEEAVTNDYGTSKQELVETFKEGTEAALSRANVVRTTKFETLQAFVMYLIPLCRNEISRSHSALTAMAIRLAECMGLHRDGAQYGLSAVETHVRRLVWYQLCFLDIRVCDSCGPRPQIREDDFDTKFPLNVDDMDFETKNPPWQDKDCFTDMTIARMRFECTEMARLIWFERPRIEKKQTTLTAVLAKCQNFRIAMEKRYGPMLDPKNPLHYMWQLVYNILSLKLHIMLLFRYASNMHRIMPERLRQTMLGSGTLLLENAIVLDTTPNLKTWIWYAGTHQQWHTALLMLAEMYAKEQDPSYEERVWRCLDYAFDLPPNISIVEKAKFVLGGLRDRTLVLQNLRKLHAPTAMDQPIGPRPYTMAIDHSARLWYPNLAKSALARMGDTPPSLSPPPEATSTLAASRSGATQSQDRHDSHYNQIQDATGMTQVPPHSSMAASSSSNAPYSSASLPPMDAVTDPYASTAPTPYSMGNLFNMSPGDTTSATSGSAMGGPGSGSPDDHMLDIDWNEWDELFPQSIGGVPGGVIGGEMFSAHDLNYASAASKSPSTVPTAAATGFSTGTGVLNWANVGKGPSNHGQMHLPAIQSQGQGQGQRHSQGHGSGLHHGQQGLQHQHQQQQQQQQQQHRHRPSH